MECCSDAHHWRGSSWRVLWHCGGGQDSIADFLLNKKYSQVLVRQECEYHLVSYATSSDIASVLCERIGRMLHRRAVRCSDMSVDSPIRWANTPTRSDRPGIMDPKGVICVYCRSIELKYVRVIR